MPLKSLYIAAAQRIGGQRPSVVRAAVASTTAGAAVGVAVYRLLRHEQKQEGGDPCTDPSMLRHWRSITGQQELYALTLLRFPVDFRRLTMTSLSWSLGGFTSRRWRVRLFAMGTNLSDRFEKIRRTMQRRGLALGTKASEDAVAKPAA